MKAHHPWQDTFALLSGARLPERRTLGETFEDTNTTLRTVPVAQARTSVFRRVMRRLAVRREPTVALKVEPGE